MELLINYFDTHNTCIAGRAEVKSTAQISSLGKRLSKSFHHVVINNDNGWEEYENQKLVSWSYPNGCGQIKVNS